MTLDDLIAKYAGLIQRQSALELKGNPVFMRACRENAEFRQWVLDRKPTMATVKIPPVEFLGLASTKGGVEVKTPQIEAEPVAERSQSGREVVAEIPRAVQLYRDVVEYGSKNGFLM